MQNVLQHFTDKNKIEPDFKDGEEEKMVERMREIAIAEYHKSKRNKKNKTNFTKSKKRNKNKKK
jgi:hypothetical protein|tara:strand:+ start:148 stop:339 length:192 start_codon:yes stop_codon:yes gene_type:complete